MDILKTDGLQTLDEWLWTRKPRYGIGKILVRVVELWARHAGEPAPDAWKHLGEIEPVEALNDPGSRRGELEYYQAALWLEDAVELGQSCDEAFDVTNSEADRRHVEGFSGEW